MRRVRGRRQPRPRLHSAGLTLHVDKVVTVNDMARRSQVLLALGDPFTRTLTQVIVHPQGRRERLIRCPMMNLTPRIAVR